MCFWKTAKDKCMYHTYQAGDMEGLYSCSKEKCPVMCESDAAICPLSSPLPTYVQHTCKNTHSQIHTSVVPQKWTLPKTHQQGPGVEQHSSMLVPFVSIGLLSAWSVLESQREYWIECSFLHLLSLMVLSISLTSMALPDGLNTTQHSLHFNNTLLQFSSLTNKTNLYS